MNKERLLMLADHLENGKLLHRRFDFNQYNTLDVHTFMFFTKEYKGRSINNCGTVGCAIGECPAIWDEWRFRHGGEPFVIGDQQSTSAAGAASLWFDIPMVDTQYLFLPRTSKHDKFGLPAYATRDMVARRIKNYVESGTYAYYYDQFADKILKDGGDYED